MLGKRVRDALYVHRDATDLLDPGAQAQLTRALELAGPRDWNVARIEPGIVGLLLYEAFETQPFPALLAAVRVDLASGAVGARSYAVTDNPLILHRKEQLVRPNHPDIPAWRALTAALEARGCFREPHLIGRRAAWASRLAEAGVVVEGHKLCPT